MAYLEEKSFFFESNASGTGPDTFSVVNLKGSEGISRLYQFEITLVSKEPEIDSEAVLTNTASLYLNTDRGLPLPYHKVLEQRVGAFLQDSDARVRIVTLVRDPIARAVSGSYQTAWRHDTDTADAESMRDSITRKLSKTNALSYCYNWFDEEVKAVFGIDVMAAPFDPEVGHQQLSGPRADLLLLKLEKLDRLWPVIGAFVGRDLAAVHSNVRSRAQDGESYRQVQSRIALPDARLRALYDHPWMHHFYSPQEIDAFVAKWSGRATADSDGS